MQLFGDNKNNTETATLNRDLKQATNELLRVMQNTFQDLENERLMQPGSNNGT